MKALYRTFTRKESVSYSRNVFLSRASNVDTRMSIPIASTRHQSTAKDRMRASQWSQHPLPVSTHFHRNHAEILKHNVSAKRTAFIALGSNLGDRIGWIEKACNEMSAKGIKITRTSSLWETAPMYVLNQESFVNGVCEVSYCSFPDGSL